jgi:hypothetical protein
MRLGARAGARRSIPYARLEMSKRWMVACDILTAAWTQHHPGRSRFCARRRAACSLTRRRAKPRLKPRRRPRSELPLHHLRPGRMGVRAPDLTSSSPCRKAEPRQRLRGSNPRRTRGVRRALRAAPRSAAPSSWALVAHTAVPPHAKSRGSMRCPHLLTLASVGSARMRANPVVLRHCSWDGAN